MENYDHVLIRVCSEISGIRKSAASKKEALTTSQGFFESR
jgi:hypothetical protein